MPEITPVPQLIWALGKLYRLRMDSVPPETRTYFMLAVLSSVMVPFAGFCQREGGKEGFAACQDLIKMPHPASAKVASRWWGRIQTAAIFIRLRFSLVTFTHSLTRQFTPNSQGIAK